MSKPDIVSGFGLSDTERTTIARVAFAKVDVLQENLPKVLHATPSQVREFVDQFAMQFDDELCRPIRAAGRSPRDLPSKVRGDLHTAVYEGVSAAVQYDFAKRIRDLLFEQIQAEDVKTAELQKRVKGG